MDRCGCDDFASVFDRRNAEKDRQRYERQGPDRTTRMLLDLIQAEGVEGASLLDVGGGIGVVDLELLEAGVVQATLADASPDSLAVARDVATDAGVLDRLTFVEGDIQRHAGHIDAADVVTLDRVVCCYGDAAGLVTLSAGLARRLYGLVLPRDRWLVRFAIAIEGIWFRLTRRAYRPYAHANAWIDSLVAAQGLEPSAERGTFFWRVVVYRRPEPAAA